jgi:hypothetical protein
MKSSDEMNLRFSKLLGEAQALMDALRHQQSDTGSFDEDDRMELVMKLGWIGGFLDGLTTAAINEMPSDLMERWASLREDARSFRYRSERPKQSG